MFEPRNISKRYAPACDTDQSPERKRRVSIPCVCACEFGKRRVSLPRIHARESPNRRILRWGSPTTDRPRTTHQSPRTNPIRVLKPARTPGTHRIRQNPVRRVVPVHQESASNVIFIVHCFPRGPPRRWNRGTSVPWSITVRVSVSYGGNR